MVSRLFSQTNRLQANVMMTSVRRLNCSQRRRGFGVVGEDVAFID
jgi:hypothetical protein